VSASQTFRKTDSRPGAIDYEVAGLTWLAQAGPQAAPIVPVLDHGSTWLTEPRLRSVAPTAEAAEEFGRALAHTHAAGAEYLGAPPPGSPSHRWIGQANLSFPTEPTGGSWGEFYATYRIAPYLDAPAFDHDDRRIMDKLCSTLASGALDHDQPELVRRDGVAARIHGDMWSGNIMWTPDGATLIDPAAQGGHAEEDLASLSVFGAPFTERIRAAYDEESPLAPGWQERIELHQVHMLVMHCAVFGRSYVGPTVSIARRWA